jgi:dolichyl-phosphate-mannose--protein O-mannosyl transferase
MNLADWTGAAGVFLILLAYILSLFRWLEVRSKTYALMNFLGASLACLASWMIDYLPFILLEGTWALVSLIALLRGLYKVSTETAV